MMIANINSQTWPQTKFVISLALFQIIIIIIFTVFVRYDPTLDAKFTSQTISVDQTTPPYDPYPCTLNYPDIKYIIFFKYLRLSYIDTTLKSCNYRTFFPYEM